MINFNKEINLNKNLNLYELIELVLYFWGWPFSIINLNFNCWLNVLLLMSQDY